MRGGHSLDLHVEKSFDLPLFNRDADDDQRTFFEECLLSAPDVERCVDIEYLIERILRHSPRRKLLYPSGSVLIVASTSSREVFVHAFQDPTMAMKAMDGRVIPRSVLLGGDWAPGVSNMTFLFIGYV